MVNQYQAVINLWINTQSLREATIRSFNQRNNNNYYHTHLLETETMTIHEDKHNKLHNDDEIMMRKYQH